MSQLARAQQRTGPSSSPGPRSTRTDGGAGEHDAETSGYNLGAGDVPRQVIDCTPGRRSLVVDLAMRIIGAHPAVYAQGTRLVRVVRADKLESANQLRTDGERLLVAPCAPEWVATELSRRADFRRFDKRAKQHVRCDPPSWVAPALLADRESNGVRPLQGITAAPVLRPDGSVWITPGYDLETGMLLAAKGELPAISSAPTKADAAVAMEILRKLLSGYRFADPFSESVALSLILTKVARHMVATVPLHAYVSPTPGSGKTEIVRSASIIGDGVEPSMCAWPRTDDEMRKTISAALLCGESFVCFDNVQNGTTLRSAALDKTLTAPVVSDRLLGKSEMLRLPNGAVWAVTGNNITPCADMVRRTIVARIDPCIERPWKRRFDWTPSDYARAHRTELLSAALTIISAHLRANSAPLAPPLQSFEQWSRIVRDALLWLGMPDPVQSQDQLADEDPDAEDRAELLSALIGCFATAEFSAEEVAQRVSSASSPGGATEQRLAHAISTRLGDKPATAARVGVILRGLKDQIAGSDVLRGRQDRHTKAMRWRIERVD